MPSCPVPPPMLHSTIGPTAGSVEHYPLHQWKASRGGHLHFKEKTFSKSSNTFDNNHMWCLFLIWLHLTTLRWTGATLCTLTVDIMWLLIFGLLSDIYQIWDEIIWLPPEKGSLISTAPSTSWEQIETSPEVSQQLNYNDWKQLEFLPQKTCNMISPLISNPS